MGKIALIVWVVLAPTLMGTFVLALLLTPALAGDEMKLILPAAVAGAVVAIPFSFLVAKKVASLTNS